jgi:hypothetical protein
MKPLINRISIDFLLSDEFLADERFFGSLQTWMSNLMDCYKIVLNWLWTFPNVSNMHIMRSKLASHYIPSYQVYHILCVYDVYHRAIYPIRTIYPLHSLVHELRFDIGKSSTASWLQCSGNRCPVGRCSPAPQWRDPQSSAEEVTGFQQIYDD